MRLSKKNIDMMIKMFLFIITFFIFSCKFPKTNSFNNTVKSEMTSLLSLINNEKAYIKQLSFDTIYNLNFIFNEHERYRIRLV